MVWMSFHYWLWKVIIEVILLVWVECFVMSVFLDVAVEDAVVLPIAIKNSIKYHKLI